MASGKPPPRAVPPRDPYVLWAEATDFRNYLSPTTTHVTVIARCKPKDTPADVKNRLAGLVQISSVYTKTTSTCPTLPTHFTAVLKRSDLPTFEAQVDRMELGMPVKEAWGPERLIKASGKENLIITPVGDRHRLIVGIIDDHIGFAHSELSGRVARVWNQNAEAPATLVQPSAWQACVPMGYGFEIADSTKLTEAAYPATQREVSHGSHLASLAAGNTLHEMSGLPQPSGVRKPLTDAAANATVIAVQMPKQVLNDTSGGAINVQVLDGLRYILAAAGPKDQVVVNVSFGTFAGAHDGSSLLEAAIDELITLRAGKLNVVLPSGNHREARTYARITLTKAAPKTTLLWKVQADDRTPSFLELWCDSTIAAAFSVTLKSPSGQLTSAAVSRGTNWVANAMPQQCTAGVFFPAQANPDPSAGVLLALAPTATTTFAGPCSEHGVWEVSVAALRPLKSSEALDIRAFIERDDTFDFPPRGRQSYFADKAYVKRNQTPGFMGDGVSVVRRDDALSSAITGDKMISVGAYVEKDREPCWYSAAGFDRKNIYRPLIVAPGDYNRMVHGIRAAGIRGVSTFRMNGTSVATAHVTRAVANAMAMVLSTGTTADELPHSDLDPSQTTSVKSADPRINIRRLAPRSG
jgi:hypothetical protein